jgi:GNAT superfamily N-acetyltransferase
VNGSDVLLREPLADDRGAVLRLVGELGYPTNLEELAARLGHLEEDPRTELVVAEIGGRVAGLAVLHVVPLLERPPLGRITAIVVSEDMRGQGVGRDLVEDLEVRARRAGCDRLDLNTSKSRTDAHTFYEHLGFELAGTRRFFKQLN